MSIVYITHITFFTVMLQVDLIGTRQVTEKQHNNYILANDEIKGGVFMSAKTGENVVKAIYKVRNTQ